MKTSYSEGQSIISTALSNNTLAPQLTSVTYSSNVSGVLLNSFSTLIFDTPIRAINGDIFMTNGNGDIRTISIADSTQITLSNNVMTVKPKDNLIANSDYTFTIPAGVIADKEGNAFTGINIGNAVSFTTQDLISPKLVNVINQNNDSIMLIFDKTVQVGNGNILFSNGVDIRKLVITDSQVSIDGNKIIINPSISLETGTDYNVQLEANTVKDVVGNNFITNGKGIGFTFENAYSSLIDTQAPKLSSITSSITHLELIFNTSIKVINGDVVISNGSDTRIISITDSSQITIQKNIISIHLKDNLIANSNYTIQFANGVIADNVGNAFIGQMTTFKIETVLDSIAPVLATATVNDSTVVLTYTDANPLDAIHMAATTDFAMTVDGVANAVTNVVVNAAAKTVTLTLTTPVLNNQSVLMNYTDVVGNTVNAIQDDA